MAPSKPSGFTSQREVDDHLPGNAGVLIFPRFPIMSRLQLFKFRPSLSMLTPASSVTTKHGWGLFPGVVANSLEFLQTAPVAFSSGPE